MQAALRMEAVVQPGHRIEVRSPELPEGATVEVIVVLPPTPARPRQSMLEFLTTLPPGPTPAHGSALEYLESLPPGPRAFPTWEEYHQHLREEKDAWER
jgi:hypothetical protein